MIIYNKSVFQNLIFMFKIKKLSNFILHDAGIKKAFLLVALILSNGACNFNPGSLDSLTWKVDLLGPLVKTEISLEEILQFEDITLPINFSMSYLGITKDTTINFFPSISLFELDPPQTFKASDFFESVTFDSGEMFYVITNNSVFTIKAGGKMIVKQISDSTIILNDIIISDILPGTTYTMNPKSNLTGQTIENELSITIQGFVTDPITTTTTIKSTDNISIDFNITAIKINQVIVKPYTFAISDTTNFNLQGDIVETNLVDGTLINYINNDLPVSIDTLKVYFLDNQKDTLSPSLFNTNISINPSESTTIIIDSIATKFINLNEAKFLHTYVRFNIPVTSTLKKEHKIKLQMVGDLKVKLN